MTRWLTAEEQVHWRSWLTATSLLPDRLGRDLQETHGMTLADYEILVRLSESPDRRLRMSELAGKTLASRSRLTHQIDRMERAGLVTREVCTDDGRGLNCVMTDKGWELLVAAAPDHVESVRRTIVDVLTPEEFRVLGEASRKLVEALGANVDLPPQ